MDKHPPDPPVARLVGETPLVDLSTLSPTPTVTIHGKLESANPGGSVKDRPALFIAREAWPRLRKGRTLVDATSGNTGIAYALMGRAFGFDVHLFMPENASQERKDLFALYGANVTLTPAEEGQDGAIAACQDHAEDAPHAVEYVDQYSNPMNPRAHQETTGPEILQQAPRITHLVAGIGTGGTITGTARFLDDNAPHVDVIGLQPARALHGMEGWKHLATNKTPSVLDASLIDDERAVDTHDAWDTSLDLIRELGLALGPSAAAALAGSQALARDLDDGHIVTILPDGYDRYASTPYAEHIRQATEHPP